MLEQLSDKELIALYRRFLDEAHTAPKVFDRSKDKDFSPTFAGYTANAVFAPVNKALEVRAELKRRGIISHLGEWVREIP